MKFGGHCEDVKYKMGDYHVKTCIFSIDIGSCDILLGVEWLHTLGLITMDFQELYMSSVKESHTYMLHGIKAFPPYIISSHHMENILKKGSFSIISQFHAIQGFETTPHTPCEK